MVSSSLQGLFSLIASIAAQAGEGQGYLRSIQTEADFEKVSFSESSLPGVDRSTKFLIPVRDDDPDLLPVLFQNVNRYKFHYEFLSGEFPEKFPLLTAEEYRNIVERRAGRKYFACLLYRFHGVEVSYGFDVFTEGGETEELPRPEEARWIFEHVTPKFALAQVAYAPRDPQAIRNAEGWVDPGFPITFAFGGGFGDYIPYTRAENYGRVKILTKADLDAANETGAFSFQDIVVLDHTPSDIEGVIAGAITETLQDGLGHLAIRTARRGTPNAYVNEATKVLAPWNGKLVRLKVDTTDYEIAEAQQADAEAWWAGHRPRLGDIPDVDPVYRSLDAVGDIPVDGSVKLITRYGGKGANFARLYSLLPAQHRVPAFVVPFYYYIHFLETNRTRSRRDPGLQVTYAGYIAELLAEPAFQANSAARFDELENLRTLIEDDGRVESSTVSAIAARIIDVHGTGDRKVRFRSSSNVEDLLEFNGAGLYSSTSVCAADDLDSDSSGPSRCDPDETKERGIARGLKKVWASLWNFRAYEEREYYQIPHLDARMAVVVSEGFPEELANGVAFTGSPDEPGDRRFIITAQAGDKPVVFPEPGVRAEKDLLVLDQGVVKQIIRSVASTEVPAGTYVLSDDQLREIGAVMATVEKDFQKFIDFGAHSPGDVVLDFEYKIDLSGTLRFKQVRPFLIATPPTSAIEYTIHVPQGMTMCGIFRENRPTSEVLRNKIVAGLRAGDLVLRADGTTPADLFEWVELGPSGPRLEPAATGVWQAVLKDHPNLGRVHAFNMQQDFLNAGELVRLTIEGLHLKVDGPTEITLDAPSLTWSINPYLAHAEANFGDPPDDGRTTFLTPCDMSDLPLYTVEIELDGGDAIHLDERFQDLEEGTGPADLVEARVNLSSLGGEDRTVASYWNLAYTAGHHNDSPFPEYLILFDPPMDVLGIGTARALQIVEGSWPWPPVEPPPQAYLLDEGFSILAPLEILSLTRLKDGVNIFSFRRGDVDFDGQLRITDPIWILRNLFLGEGIVLCEDSMDVDDSGDLEITDPILLLEFLYLGGEPPPPPFPDCGEDYSADRRRTCLGPGCR